MSVGVMEDYKLRDLRASHTLGWMYYGIVRNIMSFDTKKIWYSSKYYVI
jgi:hypothetical protein